MPTAAPATQARIETRRAAARRRRVRPCTARLSGERSLERRRGLLLRVLDQPGQLHVGTHPRRRGEANRRRDRPGRRAAVFRRAPPEGQQQLLAHALLPIHAECLSALDQDVPLRPVLRHPQATAHLLPRVLRRLLGLVQPVRGAGLHLPLLVGLHLLGILEGPRTAEQEPQLPLANVRLVQLVYPPAVVLAVEGQKGLPHLVARAPGPTRRARRVVDEERPNANGVEGRDKLIH
mmetsp:Transcript_87847/g.235637  ORF Transcript_87847/g.235637 Transcript_87847/m.235637 type:complete len:235 (+) Transcript_87847:39-743(+)